ncbi:MAG TPA: hypothetical protein VLU46_03740 [Thermoanaerobaculia bacterium]|nr:hypothetical protein [Thermoanaerobaculia bacterium]
MKRDLMTRIPNGNSHTPQKPITIPDALRLNRRKPSASAPLSAKTIAASLLNRFAMCGRAASLAVERHLAAVRFHDLPHAVGRRDEAGHRLERQVDRAGRGDGMHFAAHRIEPPADRHGAAAMRSVVSICVAEPTTRSLSFAARLITSTCGWMPMSTLLKR